MKDRLYFHSALLAVFMTGMQFFLESCRSDKEREDDSQIDITAVKTVITGDSMVYGLACEGSGDSVMVVYPFSGNDPMTYSVVDAKASGRIIGQVQIGDWVGLVLNKKDTTVADMVINLDQLKGTWTYSVLPSWKDLTNMSRKTRERMEKQLLSEMPDSMKDLYLVPREYGFSLKRGKKAMAIGYVNTNSTADEDSPVEYPKVKNYREWCPWNGKLILISSDRVFSNMDAKTPSEEIVDTLDFVSLDNDSLVLTKHGVRYGFHRKQSAITANADAQKAAHKIVQKSADELKSK